MYIFVNGPESLRSELELTLPTQIQVQLPDSVNQTQQNLSQSEELSSAVDNKPIPSDFIENSQLYQIFRNDFHYILEYCLYPDKNPMTFYDDKMHGHSKVLIEMIKKYRVNKLKTEQKIKKVINHAYDLMKRHYLNTLYPNIINAKFLRFISEKNPKPKNHLLRECSRSQFGGLLINLTSLITSAFLTTLRNALGFLTT
jgi:hypothetical protein